MELKFALTPRRGMCGIRAPRQLLDLLRFHVPANLFSRPANLIRANEHIMNDRKEFVISRCPSCCRIDSKESKVFVRKERFQGECHICDGVSWRVWLAVWLV
jgi:hypothetical protein